jgi:hypothetical protein
VKRALKATLTASYQYQIAKKYSQQQDQESQLEWADQLAIGEQVLLLDLTTPVGLKAKYRRRWTGPYRVKQITGPLSYIVESLNGLKQYRAHREHLKRVYRSPSTGSSKLEWPKTDERVNKVRRAGVSLGASSPAAAAAKPQDTSETPPSNGESFLRGREDVVPNSHAQQDGQQDG